MVRVRFAPSPTGIPHIGNTRTALFNFLFAKHSGGEFILRIEDTDRKRIVPEAEKAIIEILNWLGLDNNGKIIHQSERIDLYKEYVQMLLDKKIAHKKDGAIWIKIPEDKDFIWEDLVGNKKIKFKGIDQEEFVIIKSDGFPTYHLANVVDDYLMKITHVIRGEEWISSTPKHLYLYESFGWKPPLFAHLPVILGTDRSKLSKRHGAESIIDYMQKGYLKEALLNFMALLGWNPGGDKEMMSLDEMIDLFDLKDVNVSNPIFDLKKLDWLNGVWIRTLNKEEKLKERLEDYYKQNKEILAILKDEKGCDFVDATASRMKSLNDFEDLVSISRVKNMGKGEKELATKLRTYLDKNLGEKTWDEEKFLAALKNFSQVENIPYKVIYFLLTGKEQGIGLLELNKIYGKKFFIKNLTS